MSRYRVILAFMISVIGALFFVSTASAAWGMATRTAPSSTLKGTRANITGSGWNNSNGLVYASVAIQSVTPWYTGNAEDNMLQIGELKMYNTSSSCGHAGSVPSDMYCVEHVIDGVYEGFGLFYGATSAFGTNHRFAILLASSCGGWCAYADGEVMAGPYNDLNMPNGGYWTAPLQS